MLTDPAMYTLLERAFDDATIASVTKASNESSMPVENFENKIVQPFQDETLGQKVIEILQNKNIWKFDCQALDSMLHFIFENGSYISWRKSLRYGLPDIDVKLTYIVKLYDASFEQQHPIQLFGFDSSRDDDRFKAIEDCVGTYDMKMEIGDMLIIPAYINWCIQPVTGRQDYLIGDVFGRPWR